jgi:hypothetical protein
MDSKTKKCIDMMRQLVSDVQGAPYPGDPFEPELYRIWYEHAQRAAVDCFEYLHDNFPEEQQAFSNKLKNIFD